MSKIDVIVNHLARSSFGVQYEYVYLRTLTLVLKKNHKARDMKL